MFEYKVVPAPVRAVKVRGLKTTGERFAHLLSETMNALASEGWEYQRTEQLACEERRGLTGTRTSTQTVMVFRRARAASQVAQPALRLSDPVAPAPPLPPLAPADPVARPEPVFRPGALARGDGDRRFPPLRAGDGRDPDGP